MVFLGLYCLIDALLLISESVLIVSLLSFVCCHLCSHIKVGKGCYFLQFSWLILDVSFLSCVMFLPEPASTDRLRLTKLLMPKG